MGREARALVLPPQMAFGATWKTVAREPFMASQNRKRLLLRCLNDRFASAQGEVSVYGVVVLRDRYYIAASLNRDHTYYSAWVKLAHCDFAMTVNRQIVVDGEKRVGPVGRERPSTSAIDGTNELKVLIYAMAWAPVVAGEASHPSECWASTYNLYAHGKAASSIRNITLPRWYLDMGVTMKQRQRRFRRECERWYRDGLLDDVLGDVNRGQPLGGESYRLALRDHRKRVRRMHLDKIGELLTVTLRHPFHPRSPHTLLLGYYAVNLAAELAEHIIWTKGP